MRLVTYAVPGQVPRLGVVLNRSGQDGEHILDVQAASLAYRFDQGVGGFLLPDEMVAYLETGRPGRDLLDHVLAWAGETGFPTIPQRSVQLHAPVVRPPKVPALAGNYQAHIEEGGGRPVDKSTSVPNVFTKPGTTIIGPEDPVTLPVHVSTKVDWELEIAIVVGEPAWCVSQEDADGVITGYMILNDISSRSLTITQRRRETTERDAFFDWLNGKWQGGFAPTGPCLLTTDEIAGPGNLHMSLAVNGDIKQEGSTNQMIFEMSDIVAWVSQLCSLEPGDVIATGTSAGVGDAAGTILRGGDVITAEIEGLGSQRTPMREEG